jgi:predicted transcriptional regulator
MARIMMSLYIPQELYDKLKKISEAKNTSVNSLIVKAIREFVEREGSDAQEH